MKIITSIIITTIIMFFGTIVEKRNITVTVVNVTSNNGKVNFALYNKTNFRNEPIQTKSSTIKEGKSSVVFENIPLGEYAIICYHDKNNNDKMDFEANGMPIEDYGASNNIMNRFGPPQYEDAKFEVSDKNVSLEIKF